MHAFISKKEQSKKEETRGKNGKITRVNVPVLLRYFFFVSLAEAFNKLVFGK